MIVFKQIDKKYKNKEGDFFMALLTDLNTVGLISKDCGIAETDIVLALKYCNQIVVDTPLISLEEAKENYKKAKLWHGQAVAIKQIYDYYLAVSGMK